jgi:hypothetical protein
MDIPITFDYKGKTYSGELGQVMGAGSTATYHLMINRRYCGSLRLSAFDNRWVFDGHNGMFEELAEHFGAFLAFCKWSRDEYKRDATTFINSMID